MKKLTPRPPASTTQSPRRDDTAESTNPHLISFPSIANRADCAVVLGCGPLREGWSVSESGEAARALWGESAATVIAWCALSAYCDGDTEEYRFWFRVFAFLQAGSSAVVLEAMAEMARGRALN